MLRTSDAYFTCEHIGRRCCRGLIPVSELPRYITESVVIEYSRVSGRLEPQHAMARHVASHRRNHNGSTGIGSILAGS
jgi:hypothetical protein